LLLFLFDTHAVNIFSKKIKYIIDDGWFLYLLSLSQNFFLTKKKLFSFLILSQNFALFRKLMYNWWWFTICTFIKTKIF
jgi:hypothetical protein